jgi:5,5'-dehydrodivanillate O-demethylase
LIPRYDVWVRKDGKRRIAVRPLDCNWFQAMENSVDPAHRQILHQNTAERGRMPRTGTTRGFIDDVVRAEFYEFAWGIMKKRSFKNDNVDEHPLLFPNILRQVNTTHIRVPLDDAHTTIFHVRFDPTPDGSTVEDEEDPPVDYPNYKDPPNALHPFTRFRMDKEVTAQDHMAWETQGSIADRSRERLATSDHGLVMLREIMRREIEKVQRGIDPMCVIRDPAQNKMIDTGLSESLSEFERRPRD